MPKIEFDKQDFFEEIDKKYKDNILKLEQDLETAKAELDEITEDNIKIELNDTNRPDLWTFNGLVRHLNSFFGLRTYSYNFFEKPASKNKKIIVSKDTKEVRPYIFAFCAKGQMNKSKLTKLVQMQEKLCFSMGRNRKDFSMGFYRESMIQYPIKYSLFDPEFKFIPLGYKREMSLKEILSSHEKGIEYKELLDTFSKYPIIIDSKDNVLGFPPIINSAVIGNVQDADSDILVEFTGTNKELVMLACSIMACNMQDMGFEIERINIESDDGIFCSPCYFQKEIYVKKQSLQDYIGEDLEMASVKGHIERFASQVIKEDENGFMVKIAPYRNDFLHEVDIIEDVIISMGINSISKEEPRDFTKGSLTLIEEFSRKIKNILTGFLYVELVFNYLGSKRNYIYKMKRAYSDEMNKVREDYKNKAKEELDKAILLTEESFGEQYLKDFVQIENPMSENYQMVRNSIIPNLLMVEEQSQHTQYPHNIYEIGKVVLRNGDEIKSTNFLAMLFANDKEDNYSKIASDLNALFFELDIKYELKDCDDDRFIKGRRAKVYVCDEEVGVYGSIAPEILENFNIIYPSGCLELNLDKLLELTR